VADIVTTWRDSEPAALNVARNDGFGFFDDNVPIQIPELRYPVGVVGGKINADDTFDFAVACRQGNAQYPRGGVAVKPMRIDGTFSGHTIFEVDDGQGPAPQPTFLEIGDLNLDGTPDLVVSLGGSSKISVLINATQP
jgi:hypothetical protein